MGCVTTTPLHSGLAPSKKLIVPVGDAPVPVRLATRITLWPNTEGAWVDEMEKSARGVAADAGAAVATSVAAITSGPRRAARSRGRVRVIKGPFWRRKSRPQLRCRARVGRRAHYRRATSDLKGP